MKRRKDVGYSDFRAKVLRRDGNRCQMPGCKARRKLQVHHVLTYSSTKSLRTESSNGITLCRKCHDSIKNKEHHYTKLFSEIIELNEAKRKK
jgi:5-methylcytosine-specific restriction endonuclease McrA